MAAGAGGHGQQVRAGVELGRTGRCWHTIDWMVIPTHLWHCAPCHPPLLPQSLGMGGVQLSLRATADKMNRVLSEPARRRQLYMAGGAALLLFLLYLWLW